MKFMASLTIRPVEAKVILRWVIPGHRRAVVKIHGFSVKCIQRKIRDAVVKRPAGWKPAPKPVPKVRSPKLKDDVEKTVADAGKEFRKTGSSSAYLPKLDQGKSWWDLLTDFEGAGRRVHRIRHGGTELYRSPAFGGYDKDAAAAQTAVTLDRLRHLIAEAYGTAALAAPVDEDLESSIRAWEEEVSRKLHDSGGFGGEVTGTTGEGEEVMIEFSRSGNSFDVTLYAGKDNRYVSTRETPKVATDKEGWQKSAARAIIKAVTPMLAERWRKRP